MSKNNNNKTELFYTARREKDRKYGHISVTLRTGDRSEDELFTVRWQCDDHNDGWYGIQVAAEVSGCDFAECGSRLGKAGKLLNRIARDQNCHGPVNFLARLLALGIERQVYDGRVSNYIPVADVMPSQYQRWMARGADGYCTYSALATNEDDARIKLGVKFAQGIAEYQRYSDRFEQWVLNGKRVELDYNAQCPETPTTEELCKLLKEPAKTEEPAAAEPIA